MHLLSLQMPVLGAPHPYRKSDRTDEVSHACLITFNGIGRKEGVLSFNLGHAAQQAKQASRGRNKGNGTGRTNAVKEQAVETDEVTKL